MTKFCKRILPLLALLAALLPLSAAAAETMDTTKDTTLTIYARYDGTPVTGLVLEAYRVSSIEANGELTALPAFAAYREALDIRGKNDSAWQQMAQTLERFVTDQAILPTQIITTNEKGIAAFGTLEKGLYLLRADAIGRNGKVYAAAPCFVMLPARSQPEDVWVYQVEAWAKISENDEYTDITVEKVWKDSCVPAHNHLEITIRLWCNGALYDKITLPQNGSWCYTWKHLPTLDTWEVTEDDVEGYTLQKPIGRDGYHFTVTNACDVPQKPSQLPQTGQLWWPVPILLCAGLLCLVIGRLRRAKWLEENG